MLPTNLKYPDSKLESAYSRSYTTNIQPQNGTGPYGDGTTVIINIPTSPNLVMAGTESVLKFSLEVKNGGDTNNYMRLDKAGAHGVIQRIRVYNGSNLLEDLDNYGNLVSQLTVLQKSSACNGKDSILQGFSNDQFCDVWKAVVDPATAGAPTDAEMVNVGTSTKSNQVVPLTSGERLHHITASEEFEQFPAAAWTRKRTYCINLLSIVGSLSEKYLPLFAMTSAPLRLELQLCSSPGKFICSEKDLNSFQISDVELVCCMMELGDSAMNTINQSVQGPLQYVIPQYRNYQGNLTLTGTAQQVSIAVPAKFNSLKSLFVTLRKNPDGLITFFPHGSNRFGLSEYNVRLGSKIVPSTSPKTSTEFFLEVLKSIGSVSDINHETMISIDNYDVPIPIANDETNTHISINSSSPSFMLGMDLESYSGADKTSIFAGYNSSNDDIFLQLSFDATVTSSVRTDTYSLYDAVLVFENGVASIRY
jgi:hypothetical protein